MFNAAKKQVAPESYEPITDVETITPEDAKKYLEGNIDNRKFRPKVVDHLAGVILRGEWRLTHQGIAFDADGNLLDGQHRLMACVAADKAIRILVSHNIPRSAMDCIDVGDNRKAKDYLALAGYANATNLAAVATLLYQFEVVGHTPSITGSGRPTHSQVLDYIRDNPEIEIAVDYVVKHRRRLILLGNLTIIAFAYSRLHKINKKEALEFMTEITFGAGLALNDPAFVLREKLMFIKNSDRKWKRGDVLAIIFKAWNLRREGKEAYQLRQAKGSKETYQAPK